MGVDRIIGGLERRSGLMTDKERKTVAYHEAGHAVVGWFLQHADPLLKVTIIPRSSGALGFAQYLPQELSLHTSDQLNDMMCMALGGRAAEAHFFGSVTNGAANDLQKVTAIANQMVTVFGMSDKVGQISYQSGGGGEMEFTKPYSEATAERIDEEVKRMIDAMYERTLEVVDERQKEITQVAELLLEQETINVDDVVKLIGQRPHEMPKSYEDIVSTSSNWDASTDTDADAEESPIADAEESPIEDADESPTEDADESPIEDAEEVDLNDLDDPKPDEEATKDATKNI